MTAHRHSSAHRSGSWSHRLKYLVSGRWLINLTTIDRVLGRQQRWLRRILFPRPLRHLNAFLRKRVRRAESRVLKASRKVSKTVATSAVGESAKQLARQGRSLETKASRFIVKRVAAFFSALIPAPIRRLFATIGKAMGRVFGVVFVFIARWFGTRHYWHLVGGLPAFLLALPLAYCMIRMPFYDGDAKAKHYRAAAADAMERKDYSTAELYYRKLYQLDAMNERGEFQAAYNAYESGDESEAIEKFRALAPEDQPGYAPAHLWLAQWHLQGKSDLPEQDAYRLAEKHLQHALDRDPGNPQARALRALYFQRTGRWSEALDELRQVVKDIPQKGLTLARLYARQGRWQDAQKEVQKVLAIYEEKSRSGKELTAVEFQIWSEAYRIIGEDQKAEAVLEAGLSSQGDVTQIRDRLYEILMTRATTLGDQRGSVDEQLRLLERSWQLKPDEQDPLIIIGQLAVAPGPAGQAAQVTIEHMMTSEHPPAIFNAILGTIAAENGRFEEAADYLRKACRATPDDPQTLNNLAWVLLQTRSRLPEALQLAQRAVELKPEMPMYRETRGQLLVLVGRYAEAIDDLQAALSALGDDDAIHEAMAAAYEGLGESELAGIHRQRAK